MSLFASRTRALVPFGTSFASHAHAHAYESAYAFMFIATRFCLPFLPKGHVTRGNLSLQLAMQFLPKKILQVAVKAMSHEAICPCNLQCNFCRK